MAACPAVRTGGDVPAVLAHVSVSHDLVQRFVAHLVVEDRLLAVPVRGMTALSDFALMMVLKALLYQALWARTCRAGIPVGRAEAVQMSPCWHGPIMTLRALPRLSTIKQTLIVSLPWERPND